MVMMGAMCALDSVLVLDCSRLQERYKPTTSTVRFAVGFRSQRKSTGILCCCGCCEELLYFGQISFLSIAQKPLCHALRVGCRVGWPVLYFSDQNVLCSACSTKNNTGPVVRFISPSHQVHLFACSLSAPVHGCHKENSLRGSECSHTDHGLDRAPLYFVFYYTSHASTRLRESSYMMQTLHRKLETGVQRMHCTSPQIDTVPADLHQYHETRDALEPRLCERSRSLRNRL
jgi:hypothetical protein